MLMVMSMATVIVHHLHIAIHKFNRLAVNGRTLNTFSTPTRLMTRHHTPAINPALRPTNTNLATPSPPSLKTACHIWHPHISAMPR